jgi:hypothetical protein
MELEEDISFLKEFRKLVEEYLFGAYILHAGLYSNGVSRQALALLQVYNSHLFLGYSPSEGSPWGDTGLPKLL